MEEIRNKGGEKIKTYSPSSGLDDELYGRVIVDNDLCISLIKFDENKFFWCGDSKAIDPTNRCAKTGTLYIDGELLNIAKCNRGTFLDLGANIGGISLAFAACGWKGYAVEASEKNRKLLAKSIMINDFDIQLISKGVWKDRRKLYFFDYGPYGYISETRTNSSVEIDVTSLNDLLGEELRECREVDFVKMDVEGSEIEALAGAGAFLNHYNYPPIYVEANAWTLALVEGKTTVELINIAESYGYQVYRLQDGVWKRYNSDVFWDLLCTDYMLVHPLRKEKLISLSEENYIGPTHEDTVTMICDVLQQNIDNWREGKNTGIPYQKAVAISASLKFFPKLLNDNNISLLLRDLKEKSKNDSLLSRILDYC